MDHGEKFAKNLGSYILLHEIWKLKTKRSIKINLILLLTNDIWRQNFVYVYTYMWMYIYMKTIRTYMQIIYV